MLLNRVLSRYVLENQRLLLQWHYKNYAVLEQQNTSLTKSRTEIGLKSK